MTREDLGRRAVACKHWRWMRGMLTHRGSRVFETTKDQLGAEHVFIMKRDGFSSYLFPEDRHVPDLSDPATLGCLLALVREAWEVRRGSHAAASAFVINGAWGFGFMDAGTFVAIILPSYASEVECLVAALEAAP
jgi:hypothetical protein